MPSLIAIARVGVATLLLLLSVACARKDVHRNGQIKLRGEKPVAVARKHEGDLLQRGTASWYGVPYHGRQTSSGEIYDMELKTAAHKTLPFGTVVKVVDEASGRSVFVRINDRGPFVRGRIIDLSRGAARQLDLVRRGTTEVSLYLATPEDLAAAESSPQAQAPPPKRKPDQQPPVVASEKPRPELEPPKPKPRQKPRPSGGSESESVPVIYAPDEVIEEEVLEPGAELPTSQPKPRATPRKPSPKGGAWSVQVGSFSTRDRAESMVLQMRAYTEEVHLVEQEGLWKVRAGRFADRAQAQVLAERLETDAISTWVVQESLR